MVRRAIRPPKSAFGLVKAFVFSGERAPAPVAKTSPITGALRSGISSFICRRTAKGLTSLEHATPTPGVRGLDTPTGRPEIAGPSEGGGAGQEARRRPACKVRRQSSARLFSTAGAPAVTPTAATQGDQTAESRP